MNWRGLGIVVLVALSATAGLADAKHAAKKGNSKTPIDGVWRADGTVTVANHVSNATVGQHVSEQWRLKGGCKAKQKGTCKRVVLTYSAGGHTHRVALRGSGKNWSGTLGNQTFECTAGGVATGSLTFKLHVTSFTVHAKRKVASAIKATGIEAGTGCTKVREVVQFTLARTSF